MVEPYANYMQPLIDHSFTLSASERVALFDGFRFARDLDLRESFRGKFVRDKNGNETPFEYPAFKFTEIK